MDISIVDRASSFAVAAHGQQKRKYTDEPYWHHCRNVAGIVARYGGTEEMIAAAWLHDTVEDMKTDPVEIVVTFGYEVSELVGWLTDISSSADGNRTSRKAIDRQHLADAPAEAQTIKCADLIDNTSSIVEHDKNFARVYLEEKEALLDVMAKADPELRERAYEVLREAQWQLIQDALSE